MVAGAGMWRELAAAFCAGEGIVVGDRVRYEITRAASACGHLGMTSAGGGGGGGGGRRTTWPGWRPRCSARDMVAGRSQLRRKELWMKSGGGGGHATRDMYSHAAEHGHSPVISA